MESSSASVRWSILRRALFSRSHTTELLHDHGSRMKINKISRKTTGGFNLITREESELPSNSKVLLGPRDTCVKYRLPNEGAPDLILIERIEDSIDLKDFETSTKHDIDTTGLVCSWPSEEVLAYFSIKQSEMFRHKRVLELGSGYGLAGLTIAACTDACEVVMSDGNPQVVDYIQHNIQLNLTAFGDTVVKPLNLHWGEGPDYDIQNSFDIVLASDCTFFKEYHKDLARSIKLSLKCAEVSKAILFSPKRGDSLAKFLEKIKDIGLHFDLVENYNSEVWNLHQKFLNGHESSWPSYNKDHCYPLLVKVML